MDAAEGQCFRRHRDARHAKEATLVLSLPEHGFDTSERKAALGSQSYWHAGNVPLPFAGRRYIRVDALVADHRKITLEDDLDVPGP